MIGLIKRYARWLHTQWPAGTVEKLPEVREDGSSAVPGLYVTGDLTGVPLLKFSADTGAGAVRTIAADTAFERRERSGEVWDLAVVGAGVSGMAAALEAKRLGLRFVVVEASQPFDTVVNFPQGKPIYTYPTGMTPAGDLQFSEKADVRETLLEELRAQTLAKGIEPLIARVDHVRRSGGVLELVVPEGENIRAHRVVVAIGRSGNHRKLGVPGEELDKVSNRLHDPKDYRGREVLVVGGGDSALEAAVALAGGGASVTLSYRKPEFSRPRSENVEAARALASAGGAGSLRLVLPSTVEEIRENAVVLSSGDGGKETLPNDNVFTMIGREAPLEFFRRSGVPVRGEWRFGTWAGLVLFLLFCFWLYHWKSGKIPAWGLDPAVLWAWIGSLNDTLQAWSRDTGSFFYTLKAAAGGRSFYYTLAYSTAVVVFGVRRIRRRRTPYVTVQTVVLMLVQVIPLFLLPEIILPWLGRNGAFEGGAGRWIADQLFPAYDAANPAEREYWRAYGLVLAWPLMVWNWFTGQPLWGWLVLGSLQTFVIIPLLVYRWGKGAYCGWICPCGALAETMGDAHRRKMPHGPRWNRLNMLGQVFLAFAGLLMLLRILGWLGLGWADGLFRFGLTGMPVINYAWFVDLLWAGVLGVGLYFHFSGRVWCRFACPLAALMHVYARFSLFRIVADKKKCISCNVCTSVCHQGIDVMSFANKGLPMEDPECVRCSACVQGCPTGVLQFGRVDRKTGEVIAVDSLAASPVLMAEDRHSTL